MSIFFEKVEQVFVYCSFPGKLYLRLDSSLKSIIIPGRFAIVPKLRCCIGGVYPRGTAR
jgi:hypothetical protein